MPTLALYGQTMKALRAIPSGQLGPALVDYIQTNEHDLAWDGFSQRDLHGFGKVLRDFLLAYEAGGLKTEEVDPLGPLTEEQANEVFDTLEMGRFELQEQLWDTIGPLERRAMWNELQGMKAEMEAGDRLREEHQAAMYSFVEGLRRICESESSTAPSQRLEGGA